MQILHENVKENVKICQFEWDTAMAQSVFPIQGSVVKERDRKGYMKEKGSNKRAIFAQPHETLSMT